MAYLLLGIIALVALIGLGMIFVRTDARTLVRTLRYVAGGGLIFFGGVLALGGRWGIGLPLIIVGVSALATGRVGPIDFGAARRSDGQGSDVRSADLAMHLDHDTGEMDGEILRGAFAGRKLSSLSEAELRVLDGNVSADEASRSLLEAYLDRRIPDWRDDVDRDAGSRTAGAPRTSGMSKEEAYEVLGLAAGASEAEIRAAHRRLMKGVHPDQGGSTLLAAKINEAKDRLLGKHR